MKKKFKERKFQDKGKGFRNRELGTRPNSPEWYYPTPEIQKLAAAVNLNNRVGDTDDPSDGVNLVKFSGAIDRMPGVFVNPLIHTPGRATAPTDPVNEAARSMMDRIREMINATRNYEMPDLVKYFLAIADLFAWIEFLKLIYRVCNKFNPLNRYTPTAILRAMHINTSDINNLRIQLKFYIDTLAHRVSNLKLPTEIKVGMSWIEDFKHIYIDEDIAKAQYIVNAPFYIWKYTIDAGTSQSKLVMKNFFSTFTFSSPATVNDLKNFTEDLLSEIVNDEDFAIITGDVMKSYSSFYEITPVTDEVIEFEYSKEFLEKWHNSCQFSGLQSGSISVSDFEIKENTSPSLDPYIEFNPTFTCADAAALTSERRGAGKRFLDFYDREVTSDQIINACLWMFNLEDINTTAKTYKFNPVGTTTPLNCEVVYYDSTNTLRANTYYGATNITIGTGNFNLNYQQSTFDTAIVLLSKWNYHPMTVIVVIGNAVTATDLGYKGVIGDFGNYTLLDPRIMNNIKLSILYGQFNVQHLLQ